MKVLHCEKASERCRTVGDSGKQIKSRTPPFRGELLSREGRVVHIDDGIGRWWTFADGRVTQTLKYGFEVVDGWKVVADNLQLHVEDNRITHESVRAAIERRSEIEFWTLPEMRRCAGCLVPAEEAPEMSSKATASRRTLGDTDAGWTECERE